MMTSDGPDRRVARPRRAGHGLPAIASGPEVFPAVSADGRRVAVARDDGTVGLYSAKGRLLLTVRPSSLREVALRKDYLVALTRAQTLEVYDANNRALVRTIPVEGGSAHLDVHSGIAVYAVGRIVHLLRLADGRDAVLATAPRVIAGLERRLVSPTPYNTVRGGKEIGNLAFVPLAKATSLLG